MGGFKAKLRINFFKSENTRIHGNVFFLCSTNYNHFIENKDTNQMCDVAKMTSDNG